MILRKFDKFLSKNIDNGPMMIGVVNHLNFHIFIVDDRTNLPLTTTRLTIVSSHCL
jgi:hypothetical protein